MVLTCCDGLANLLAEAKQASGTADQTSLLKRFVTKINRPNSQSWTCQVFSAREQPFICSGWATKSMTSTDLRTNLMTGVNV